MCNRLGGEGKHTFAAGAAAEVVVLAIPYAAAAEVLAPLAVELTGKLVIDCTNPLQADWSPLPLGEQNSAGETLARLLPQSRLVKAFNTIFADVMTPERQNRAGLRVSAFVAGDDAAARLQVATLAADIGFAPVDVGPLSMARYLEAMAHLNIQIAIGQGGGTDAAFIYHQRK
jgi:predicted dinucleotide-binding enzyme